MKNGYRALLTLFILATASLFATEADAYRFVHECGPSWSNTPVKYYINANGTKHIPNFSTIERVFQDSFDEWAKPCCSSFSAEYEGSTQLTATNNQGRIVMSFEDNAWPSQLGGRNTIAVTLLSWTYRCDMVEAPILFNSVNHTFRTNGSNTDLQSIATHEIGHLLGLDHSHLSQATMYAAYVGGSGARSLHEDDVGGVCALYPRACTCTTTSECLRGEECLSGLCQRVPCTSNAQCENNEECVNGDCIVPPCTGNADCDDHFECNAAGKCVSTCPVCRDCQRDSDCGFNGFCADFGAGGKCIVACSSGRLCPGDAACFQLDQGSDTFYICLNPTASQNPCPDSYVCKEPGIAPDPCEGVTCGSGQRCHNGVCIDDDSNPGGNNEPGDNNNTNNNTGGTTGPGGGNPEDPDDEDDIIIILPQDGSGRNDSSCMCATAPSSPTPLLPLIAVLGMLAVATRRRNKSV